MDTFTYNVITEKMKKKINFVEKVIAKRTADNILTQTPSELVLARLKDVDDDSLYHKDNSMYQRQVQKNILSEFGLVIKDVHTLYESYPVQTI